MKEAVLCQEHMMKHKNKQFSLASFCLWGLALLVMGTAQMATAQTGPVSIVVTVLPVGYKGLQGIGTGTVSISPPGPYTEGDNVTVTANPAAGSFVTEWGGDMPDAFGDIPQLNLLSFNMTLDSDKDLTLLFSREYQPGEGVGDVDLDGLPDEWEYKYGLDYKDATGDNGRSGNPSGDYMPGGWTPGGSAAPYGMNQFPSGAYPAALANLNTNWPYRFPVTNVRPNDYYMGVIAFNNWFQARGFDGWYGNNPLTLINDDPGTNPTMLSTAGGASDGWKYYFFGSLINDSILALAPPRLDGVALDLASFDPDVSWDIPVLPILSADMLNVFGAELVVDSTGDLDADCATLQDEFIAFTDPFHWDTDADEISDGYEIKKGLNPIDPSDATGNPSGDHMAYTADDTKTNRHAQVYAASGYDPRTAWGASFLSRGTVRELTAQPNTIPFTSHEKFLASLYLGFINGGFTCADFNRFALDPSSIDSDSDGIFDGWELYVGLNPMHKPIPMPDGDDDGLDDFQEFSAYDINLTRGATWPNGRTHFDLPWLNKVWPTDPNNEDTDGDGLVDGAEGGYKNVEVVEGDEGGSSSLALLKYNGGTISWNKSCYEGGGMNPTTADTDGEGMPDHWEATFRSSIYSMEDTEDRNGMDPTVKDAGRDYDEDGLVNYQEYVSGAVAHWRYSTLPAWTPGLPLGGYDPWTYFTGIPHDWDWHLKINKVEYQYIPKYLVNTKVFYTCTSPISTDTDRDGMDDFWEIYHGLNPLFGTIDIDASVLADTKNVVAGVPPTFDIRLLPYVAGSPFSDPDQDGLPNSAESIQANVSAPAYYHTGPAPLWVTDTSYQLSWVNLYYGLGSLQLHWYYASGTPPSYLFSFASDEGFDTDSDMLGDRAELVSTPTSPGSTDPLSLESPPRRRALYLDGDAAARTRGQFLHPNTDLTAFTIEAWVRPSNPAKGEMQVIMERTMHVPNGNIMGWPDSNRRNFRLGLDAAGVPFVAYNGLGFDALYVEAKAPDAFALPADQWVHLAGTYNGSNLYLYVNGEMHGHIASTERPANGWYTGNPAFVFSSPIVLGAQENNPDGWVSGTPVLVGPAAGIVPTQPDLSNYFEGWMDEVRIWNGAKTSAQILSDLFQKKTISDVVASRAAVASGESVPELMYLYTFNNLLDPLLEGVAPAGFELLNGRPNDGSYPNVPWWGTAADRSTAYDNYLYVPWIANVAARFPLDPPADSPYNLQMAPVESSAITTNITSSTNTVTGVVTISTNITTNVTSSIVQLRSYPNTANPYNFGYYHGASLSLENHPDYLNLAHLVFSTRDSSLFNDLLPLRNARVDADVQLWDGAGTGLQPFDSNEDGIPDWWYLQNGFDPLGTSIAEEDPDGDGLSNFWEYRIGSDPFSTHSLDFRVSDADFDSDGDTLSNIDEVQTWGTDPDNPDTDDDTIRDDEEIANNTSALYSRSPLVPRSMVMDGTSVVIPEPRHMIAGVMGSQRFQTMNRWYLGAMVRPDAAQTGSLIRRTVESGELNFELGLANNIPFVRFDNINGATFTASGTAPLPTDRFSELLAQWNPTNHVLNLIVDDCVVGSVNVVAPCITGRGETIVGDGITGRIDDVFIGRNLLGGGFISPDYVLMIDVSGSMGAEDRMQQAIDAALVAINGMPSGAAMAIVSFNGTVSAVQDFTTDKSVLTALVNSLTPGGGTSYSAPVTQMIELITDRVSPGGFVGILISDGEPQSVPSDADLAQVVALDAKINTVGFGSSILAGSTFDLERVAQQTGGTFFPAPSGDELSLILSALVSGEASDESCFYPFDDGGIYAEDYTQLLKWDYALSGVTFDEIEFSTLITPFNYSFVDSEEEMPKWWIDWFLANSDEKATTDDPDGDGLNNLNEWRISFLSQQIGLPGISPMLYDSDGNGTSDGDEDQDGDTLISRDEQANHKSRVDRFDTDDDALNDNEELRGATDPAYSMMPFVMRALRFGSAAGAGEVLVEDRVRGIDTEHLGAEEWTIECYAQPEVVPPVGVDQPLVQRRLRCSELINYEVGIRNDGTGQIVPYVRYNHFNDGNIEELIAQVPMAVDEWTHLAGRLSDGKLSLVVNGVEVKSINTSYDPAQGPGDVYFGGNYYGGNGVVGRLKDIRIWKIGRSNEDIRDFRERGFIFDARAADPGLLRVSGDQGHLREVADPGTARDQLTVWTLECWVRTTDSEGTLISRVNGGNVVEDTDDFNYSISVGQEGRLVGRFAIQWREVTSNTNGTTTIGDVVINTTINTMVSALPVNDGEWHHVAYTRDVDNAVLYIDGELSAIQDGFLVPISIPATVQNLDIRILDGPVEIGRNLVGDIDEVRIWKRALTPDEIKSVMSQNLFGNESGLITYFSFDFQQGIHAEDRASVRNPDAEYGTYIPSAQRVGTSDQAPIENFFPLRVYAFTSLLGYFPADDGGVTLENLLYQNNWDYAGQLVGDALFDVLPESNKPFLDDSDGDGLPDWWETLVGLNPGSDRDANGAYGDPDNDGLNNWAEWLAGTNPMEYDTDGDGLSDYDSNSGGASFGSLFMDGDKIPDVWEALYPSALSPLRFDAELDPDGDGWNNLSEYLGAGYEIIVDAVTTTETIRAVSPTVPDSASSYPVPSITFTFLGKSTANLADTPLTVWAFSDAAMSRPDAQTVVPLSGIFANGISATVERWDVGYLRQGSNIFMAFIDANGDGHWNAGEWAGFSENITDNIQWGSAQIPIALTDKPVGYIRFSWEQNMDAIAAAVSQVGGTTYKVSVKALSQAGQPIIYSVTRDLESMDRPFMTEMDFIQAGVAPLYGSYQWVVAAADTVPIVVGTNTVSYPTTVATPAIYSPPGTVLYAQEKLRMTLDPNAAQIQIQIVNVASGQTVLNTVKVAPYVDSQGMAEMDLPVLAGFGSFTNGQYRIQVRAYNPRATASSSWVNFAVDLKAPSHNTGAAMISGRAIYFGWATNAKIVVEAYVGSGFDQSPVARVYADSTNDFSYQLMGLRLGRYYIRAFHDRNSNGVLDSGEDWGLLKGADGASTASAASMYAADYTVRRVAITTTTIYSGNDLVIHDADTDNDGLADMWEYLYAGSLTAMNGYSNLSGDDWLDIANFQFDRDPNLTYPPPPPAPLFMARRSVGDGTQITLTFDVTGLMPKVVEVQSATNLSSGQWKEEYRATINMPGVYTNLVPASSGLVSKFFRIRYVN